MTFLLLIETKSDPGQIASWAVNSTPLDSVPANQSQLSTGAKYAQWCWPQSEINTPTRRKNKTKQKGKQISHNSSHPMQTGRHHFKPQMVPTFFFRTKTEKQTKNHKNDYHTQRNDAIISIRQEDLCTFGKINIVLQMTNLFEATVLDA